MDGVEIDPARLALPAVDGPLVVEGAGGALVPLTEDLLFADMMARWRAPTIVCARTELGTIHHSLLTIEALRARGVPSSEGRRCGKEGVRTSRYRWSP